MKILFVGILALFLSGCTTKKLDYDMHSGSKIEVYKKFLGRQCQDNVELITMLKQELLDRHIVIFSERLQGDGNTYIQGCDTPQEQLAVFSIAVNDLKKAIEIGFKPFTY